MENLDVIKTADVWSSSADTVFAPHSEAEYQRFVTLLDRLIDEVGENESHPLASLMEIVGVIIENTKTSVYLNCALNSRVFLREVNSVVFNHRILFQRNSSARQSAVAAQDLTGQAAPLTASRSSAKARVRKKVD